MAASKDNATSIAEVVTAMNGISRFLAHEQIRDATDLDRCLPATSASDGAPQVDVIAFCASAVLFTAENVFTAVNQVKAVRSTWNRCLRLSGGPLVGIITQKKSYAD